jgi:hypothetical protein
VAWRCAPGSTQCWGRLPMVLPLPLMPGGTFHENGDGAVSPLLRRTGWHTARSNVGVTATYWCHTNGETVFPLFICLGAPVLVLPSFFCIGISLFLVGNDDPNVLGVHLRTIRHATQVAVSDYVYVSNKKKKQTKIVHLVYSSS